MKKTELTDKITSLEQKLKEAEAERDGAKERADGAVLILNDFYLRIGHAIARHEKGRAGARPCLMEVKGYANALADMYKRQNAEEEVNEDTEGPVQGEDEEEPSPAGKGVRS